MAEAILNKLLTTDSDGDGIPDILDRLQNDEQFGPSKANWQYRRLIVISVIVTSYSNALAMVGVWLWKVLFTHTDIAPNLLNFGTTAFWALLFTATSTLGIYLGVAQSDTSSYRREMGRLASVLPAPQQPQSTNYSGYGYTQPYPPTRTYPDYVDTSTPSPIPPAGEGSVVSPIPVSSTPLPVTDGPTERKPGVII